MFLYVTNLVGKKIRIEVEQHDSVITLKKAVQAVEGYDLEEFGLVLGGQKLDSDRRISDYGLQNESSLTLVRLNCKT